MFFDGLCMPRTVARLLPISVSLTNSLSISVAIVEVKGSRGHSNWGFYGIRLTADTWPRAWIRCWVSWCPSDDSVSVIPYLSY